MNPNDKQIGGSHYATGAAVQHWDYVMEALNGRYLEGNISKYVSRHAKKNGLEDLKKAQHYLEKLSALYAQAKITAIRAPGHVTPARNVGAFITSAGLGYWESRICVALTQWASSFELLEIHSMLHALVRSCAPQKVEPAPEEPGSAYVNQDGSTNPAVHKQAAELYVQGYIPLVNMGVQHPTAVLPFTVARIDQPDWVERLARALHIPAEAFYQRGIAPRGSDCGRWGEYWCHLYSRDRLIADEEVFWRLHELCTVSGRLKNVTYVKRG